MTIETLIQAAETGITYGLPLAAAVGVLGHALAAIPNKYAQIVGNALNAVSIDFVDLVKAFAPKKDGGQ
jgi:hypothetical protein